MPPFVDDNAKKPLRELIYGPPKSKKTWWAAGAAEAGYNVIVIDGDDGTHIIGNLSEEAQKRVQVIDAVDNLSNPIMSVFMVNLLKGAPFIWDEQAKCRVLSPKSSKIEHSHYRIDISKLTMNDVLIIDSWSALAWSIAFRFSKENQIDLSDASKTEWEGYRWSGALMNWMLNQLNALKCHIIVVAHQDVYEKKKADGKTVEMTRTQPKSISGPHAMQLAKHFSEVLFFKIQGSSFKIDASPNKDRDGGCRSVPPKVYDWDELQFMKIIELAGLPAATSQPCEALKYYPSGTPLDDVTQPTAEKKTPSAALKASGNPAGKSASATSLTGLLKKK